MNNPQLDKEPSDSTVLISAVGWIGVICVFLLVVAVAYLPNRASSTEEKNAAIRYQVRNEVRAEQARLVSSYEWVNQPEGVVRIPVDRAMRLAVEELKAEQQTMEEPSL